MDYSFNGEIAAMYGVDEAVFIHNLYWWIKKNKANGRHLKDGRAWTYNSARAFSELFPFWSLDKVKRMTAKLEKAGAVICANYNDLSFDKTKWYSLSDDVIFVYEKTAPSIARNRTTDSAKSPDGKDEIAPTIPDSKPYIKPDSKHSGDEPQGNDLDEFPPEVKTALLDWFTYKAERKESYKPKGRESFLSSVGNKLKQYKPAAVVDVIQNSMANNWKGVIWDTIDKTAVATAEPVLIPKTEKDFFEMTPEEMFG